MERRERINGVAGAVEDLVRDFRKTAEKYWWTPSLRHAVLYMQSEVGEALGRLPRIEDENQVQNSAHKGRTLDALYEEVSDALMMAVTVVAIARETGEDTDWNVYVTESDDMDTCLSWMVAFSGYAAYRTLNKSKERNADMEMAILYSRWVAVSAVALLLGAGLDPIEQVNLRLQRIRRKHDPSLNTPQE